MGEVRDKKSQKLNAEFLDILLIKQFIINPIH